MIGHDPREAPRAIVTTANDAARQYGIGSGMAGARALTLAPDTLFIPPRFELYREHSKRLMASLRGETGTLQQLSVDEAWLDWSHRGFDPADAVALRARVKAATGLSVSLGVAACKLVSKMATEVAKEQPERVFVVPPGGEQGFLGPRPIRALYGVGPRTAARLQAIAVETIGQIAELPLETLVAEFGSAQGRALFEHSRGLDDSELQPEREPKSYSAEHTFQVDTRDRAELWAQIRSQAERIAARLQKDGFCAAEVALKLRYAGFQRPAGGFRWNDLTRQVRLSSPSAEASVLAETAALLMRRHWDSSRPVRLIGLRASRFCPSGSPIQLTIPGA